MRPNSERISERERYYYRQTLHTWYIGLGGLALLLVATIVNLVAPLLR